MLAYREATSVNIVGSGCRSVFPACFMLKVAHMLVPQVRVRSACVACNTFRSVTFRYQAQVTKAVLYLHVTNMHPRTRSVQRHTTVHLPQAVLTTCRKSQIRQSIMNMCITTRENKK